MSLPPEAPPGGFLKSSQTSWEMQTLHCDLNLPQGLLPVSSTQNMFKETLDSSESQGEVAQMEDVKQFSVFWLV